MAQMQTTDDFETIPLYKFTAIQICRKQQCC